MKYLLLDGENVDVKGCKSCPLGEIHVVDVEDDMSTLIYCWHMEKAEVIQGEVQVDHYREGCPLSPYQSLHHLYVSIKCIYVTIKTLYDNFREWYRGSK